MRLPKKYRFTGDRVLIKQVGNAVVLLPEQDSWKTLFDSLDRFYADFINERSQPGTQGRKDVFD